MLLLTTDNYYNIVTISIFWCLVNSNQDKEVKVSQSKAAGKSDNLNVRVSCTINDTVYYEGACRLSYRAKSFHMLQDTMICFGLFSCSKYKKRLRI